MNMTTVLARLGVDGHTLSADEKRALDEDGYLRLENLMTPAEVAAFVRCLDELAQLEGEDAGKEVHQEQGTIRLSNLIDKDPIFEKCVTSPRLLAAIRHVLGDEFKKLLFEQSRSAARTRTTRIARRLGRRRGAGRLLCM